MEKDEIRRRIQELIDLGSKYSKPGDKKTLDLAARGC